MMVGHQVRWAGATDNYHAEFHHDEHVARAQGLPGIVLSGPLFGSLLLTKAIQWLGGRAQLKRFQNRNSRPTMPRDTVVIHGRVSRAYREGDENLVELECWIVNQRGETTTTGLAVAALPSRIVRGSE
jgi:hydroxyacyl-ACP dehydratase HTD2-like protein with hotdog domain